MITIKTSHGDIAVELFDEKAPISCENFRQYISDGHYNDTIFHRVMPNFMIQGGGFDADMSQKATRDPIKNEADNGDIAVAGFDRNHVCSRLNMAPNKKSRSSDCCCRMAGIASSATMTHPDYPA